MTPIEDDANAPDGLQPGELVAERRRVLVGTGAGVVRLDTLTPPGRRLMPAVDWARGARPPAGTVLGNPNGAVA